METTPSPTPTSTPSKASAEPSPPLASSPDASTTSPSTAPPPPPTSRSTSPTNPVPLETTFHAYVDATNGDTTLAPVNATLLHSHFIAQGTVVNIHGKGHDINLTVTMPHGRIEDLLQLAMKSQPPIMRGNVVLNARLHIPPGNVRVIQKILLAGTVHIQEVEFTNPKLQDRIDSLSMRAQGHPSDSKAAGSDLKPEVASQMTVDFSSATRYCSSPPSTTKSPAARPSFTALIRSTTAAPTSS